MANKIIYKHRRGDTDAWKAWLSDTKNILLDGEIGLEDVPEINGEPNHLRLLVGDGQYHTYETMPKIDMPGYAKVVDNAVVSQGYDYAEYFQWASDVAAADRVSGRFVTIVDNTRTIRLAQPGDKVLGVTSNTASIIGNWSEVGRDSADWAIVGMLGIVEAQHDGTCTDNGYAMIGENGVATKTIDAFGYKIVNVNTGAGTVEVVLGNDSDVISRIRDRISDVAVVIGVDNEVYFNDLQSAITAINNDAVYASGSNQKLKDSTCMTYKDNGSNRWVVVLLSDIALNEQQNIERDLEINFAGHTIATNVFGVNKFKLFNLTEGSLYFNGKHGGGIAATATNTSGSFMIVGSQRHPFYIDGGLYTLDGYNVEMSYVFVCGGNTEIRNTKIIVNYNCKNSESQAVAIYINGECDAIIDNNIINVINKDVGIAYGYAAAKANKLVCSNNIVDVDAIDNDYFEGKGSGSGGNISDNVAEAYLINETINGTFAGLLLNAVESHVSGGLYTSCSHGGIYFSGNNTTSYVKNATIGCKEYSGEFNFEEMTNGYYGSFYIGGSEDSQNVCVYMDNCELYGLSDANRNTGPVINGGSGKSVGHKLYISNTNLTLNPITQTVNMLRVDEGSIAIIGENTNITTESIVEADGVIIENLVSFNDFNFSKNNLYTNEQIVANRLNIKNGSGAGSLVQVATGSDLQPSATGKNAVAFGIGTTANADYALAEGVGTHANAPYSHAEGYNTSALGNYAHSENRDTVASGNYTHAEGYGTIARGSYQHVQGKFNIEDTSNKYAHIVGNGNRKTVDNETVVEPSNAHTLDWKGVAWFQGGVKIGGTGQDDTNAVDLIATINALTKRVAALEAQLTAE